MAAVRDWVSELAAVNITGVTPLVDADGVLIVQPHSPGPLFDPFIPDETPYPELASELFDEAFGDTEEMEFDETTRIEVARFPIVGTSYSIGPKGTLKLTLLVERAAKYDAMAATDWPGLKMEVVIHRPVLPSERGTNGRRVGTAEALRVARGMIKEARAEPDFGPDDVDDDE